MIFHINKIRKGATAININSAGLKMASTCISKIRAIFQIIVGHTGGYPDPDQRFFSAFCAN